MKDGAYLVNTARGAICVAEDVAEAVKSGKLAGYGGDVWDKQPAPKDHPWRTMDNKDHVGNAMTVHISGTSLDAQKRYAQGVKNILNSYFSKSLIIVHRILLCRMVLMPPELMDRRNKSDYEYL